MQFQSIEDLPENVRKQMPEGAQRVYLEAYNNAWKDHDRLKHGRENESREEEAEKFAWQAVSAKYYRGDDGYWHKS